MQQEINPEIVNAPNESSQEQAPAANLESVPTDSATLATPEWKWADEILGKGPRPEFLKEKYGSVEDQAKAYLELEKRMGEFKGAPKDGYKFDNLPDGFSAEDPLLQGFSETFKEMNLSQEGFERVIGKFVELANVDNTVVSNENLMRELGADGKMIMDRVDNWMSNFSEQDQKTIRSWGMSAEDIRALDAIRAGRSPSRAPTTHEAESRYVYETAKHVEAEKNANWARYTRDDAYREEITRRWTDALLREGKS
jgi:hypothetical protein